MYRKKRHLPEFIKKTKEGMFKERQQLLEHQSSMEFNKSMQLAQSKSLKQAKS